MTLTRKSIRIPSRPLYTVNKLLGIDNIENHVTSDHRFMGNLQHMNNGVTSKGQWWIWAKEIRFPRAVPKRNYADLIYG